MLLSIDSKLREPSPTGIAIGFFFLWVLFAFGAWHNFGTQTDLIRNELNREAELAIHGKAMEIDGLLTATFNTLRTISILPSVDSSQEFKRVSGDQAIVKMGRMSKTDYELAQHLLSDLFSSVAVSRVYVVHDSFRSDLDQFSLVRFEATLAPQASATEAKAKATPIIETPDAAVSPEYAEFARHLAYFRERYPIASANSLDSMAPINSGMIRIVDERQFSSLQPSDQEDASGFSFSVPIYDRSTRQFRGIVTAVLRANALEAVLTGLPVAPISGHDIELAHALSDASRLGQSSNFLLKDSLSGIRIYDKRNTYWASDLANKDVPVFEHQVKLTLPGPHAWVLQNYVSKFRLDSKINSVRSNALIQFALLSFALALVWAILRSMQIQQIQATRRHLALANELGQASDDHAKTRLKLQATLDTIADLYFEVGLDGRYHDVYSRWPDLFNYQGKTIAETLPVEVAKLWNAALIEANEHGVSSGKEYQLSLPHGQRWFELSVSRKKTPQGEEPRFIVLAHDITVRKLAEQELRKREEFFRLISENIGDYIAVVNLEGKFVYISPAYERFIGSATEPIGLDAFSMVAPDDQASVRDAFSKTLLSGISREMEYRHIGTDGKTYSMECKASVICDSGGQIENVVLVSRDIAERKAKDREIENLAFYDSLTNLPNRRLLLDRLRQALARVARTGNNGALMFIDLDNFKSLNDTLGHAIGDILLTQVAGRLRLCVRENDTVARLGGDEFVVMLEDLDHDLDEAAGQAELIAEKILAALNRPYNLGDFEHTSTPSIGVTVYGKQNEGMDDLLKRADLAMYQAKTAGRNAIRFFDADMRARVLAQIALEADIRDGLGKGQFILYYQAQIDIDGRICGAESLMRWRHPLHGLMSPSEFIPLAEESGLILPLGQSIMEIACRQLAAWATQSPLAKLSLAVNVSARQFLSANFVSQVLTALEQSGASPHRLKLELTESLFVNNVDEIIARMTTLKAQGVNFSLDDFGTGYSSLSYLKRLPLDQLKIDQSFVRDLLTDPNDVAIARTIVGLAESLSLSVIAEGVETEGQRQCLAQQGCYSYQGYLFSEPLPIEEFEILARNNLQSPGNER